MTERNSSAEKPPLVNAFASLAGYFTRERRALICAIAVCLLAAAAVRAVFLFKDEFATGFDGYYYALQVKSLIVNGELLNRDNSIAFSLLRFFSFFIPDVPAANKIATIFFCSLAAVPVFLLARRLTGSPVAALTAALLFSLSFSQIYMSFEIVKNGVSMLFVAAALYCLSRFFETRRHKLFALGFSVLGFFTHKAAAGLLIVMGAAFFISFAWFDRLKLFRKRRPVHFIAGAAALAAVTAAIVFSIATLRPVDLGGFLGQLSPESVLGRFRMFLTETTNARIKTEYLLYYAVPLAFLPFLVKRLRTRSAPPSGKAFLLAAYLTQWVLINPLLRFSWISTSYRLMLMSALFAALELGIILKDLAALAGKGRKPAALAACGVLLILSFTSLPGMYRRFHTDRYPAYARYAGPIMALKTLLGPDDKLIAQQGLSFFIWYETGIYTQHFLPEDDTRYYRLAYGLGPGYFTRFTEAAGCEEPVAIKLPYVLVREKAWRMFYREYGDRLKIVHAWENPEEIRPATVYGVKPKFERRADW